MVKKSILEQTKEIMERENIIPIPPFGEIKFERSLMDTLTVQVNAPWTPESYNLFVIFVNDLVLDIEVTMGKYWTCDGYARVYSWDEDNGWTNRKWGIKND